MKLTQKRWFSVPAGPQPQEANSPKPAVAGVGGSTITTELRTEISPSDSSIHPPSRKPQRRCCHTYADGRRCRTPRAPKSSLCAEHARSSRAPSGVLLQTLTSNIEPPDTDVSADLLGPIEDFRTAAAINHSLGKLFILLASNRISPRRGAVLAYVCQLLLQSLGHVRGEVREITDWKEAKATIQRVLDATSPLRDRDAGAGPRSGS